MWIIGCRFTRLFFSCRVAGHKSPFYLLMLVHSVTVTLAVMFCLVLWANYNNKIGIFCYFNTNLKFNFPLHIQKWQQPNVSQYDLYGAMSRLVELDKCLSCELNAHYGSVKYRKYWRKHSWDPPMQWTDQTC